MFNKLVGFVLVLQIVGGSASFASDHTMRNYDFDIKSSCFNSTTNSSDPDCYPFWYENSDGGTNAFANYVAMLNYLSPVISLGSIKLSHYLISRWDNQIDKAVETELKGIANAEKEIRTLLSEVVQQFDNGINTDLDYALALGMIETLNRDKCKHCVDEFVAIVSKHFPTVPRKDIEQIVHHKDEMVLIMSETDDEESADAQRRTNQMRFYKFAEKIKNSGKCQDHLYEEIPPAGTKEKTVTGRVASAFWYNWTHPFHLSSLTYATLALAIPTGTSFVVDTDNRAGSLIGDMANISNAIVIPTVQAVSVIQNWLNYDRKKSQKLAEEIERRLAGIEGVIEIAGRVIGTMDNNITLSQARGYLKALIIIGWPSAYVEQFRNLASRERNDIREFSSSLKAAFTSRGIPFDDLDILNAFDRTNVKDTTIGS